MPMKHVHYDRLIKPLIKTKLEDEEFGILLSKAFSGWALGVTLNDMNKVRMVEYLCNELVKSCESEFSNMMGELVSAAFDSHTRMSTASERVEVDRENQSVESRFAGMLEKHKTLFESEFRLWSTIPYFFVVKVVKKKSKAKSPDSFVHVSAGAKYYAIKGITTTLTFGRLPDLIGAIDIRIRNAGGGHDSWEILENDKIKMYFVDPHSGKRDGERIFSEDEFRKYIKACEKAIWILEMGLNIFLVNNPKFYAKVRTTRIPKKSEIQAKLDALLQERWMRVRSFELDRERKQAAIVLEYVKRTFKAERKEMIFGNGQKFVILQKEIYSKYRKTILYALHIFISQIEKKEIPTTNIQVFDIENQLVANLTFAPVELEKLLGQLTEHTLPKPKEGDWPETTFSRIVELRVNPLFEKAMQKLFDDLPDNEDEWSAGIEKAKSQIAKYITL